MSYWKNLDFENRIRQLLSAAVYIPQPNHHFNRPFMTAYQIAIEFNNVYPSVAIAMGYQVGGVGINQKVSLSQYIGRELSQRIKSGEIIDIEGAFLSNSYITQFAFNNNGIPLTSSLVGTYYDHSIFRLI